MDHRETSQNARNLALANLIGSIGREAFYEALLTYIGQVVENDSALIVVFDGNKIPSVCCDQLLPAQRNCIYETWMNGVFELGPYYNIHRLDKQDGLYMLSDIAPDNFRASEYFKLYYRLIKQADMAGYLIKVGENLHVVVFVSRIAGSSRFSSKTRRILNSTAPVVINAVVKHWETKRKGPRNKKGGKRHELLKSFGSSILSEREYEIVHLFLRGHSTKNIGFSLSITDHTVRAHLKHAYRKLKVRSQGELFSLLLRRLNI
ncbi:MAG: helix-turn-helix transcriptional regulator [Paracoccaceae bacterium]|nr:helix-turn-helix transcriptional regulator [Paracoccaceae bacterium]